MADEVAGVDDDAGDVAGVDRFGEAAGLGFAEVAGLPLPHPTSWLASKTTISNAMDINLNLPVIAVTPSHIGG